jgi:hypothetical protein
MGMAHPCSSVFSKIMTAIFCNYLDRTLQKEHGHFFIKALNHAESVIAGNRPGFNQLVFTLSKTGRLSPNDAKSAFKNFSKVPLTLDGVKS